VNFHFRPAQRPPEDIGDFPVLFFPQHAQCQRCSSIFIQTTQSFADRPIKLPPDCMRFRIRPGIGDFVRDGVVRIQPVPVAQQAASLLPRDISGDAEKLGGKLRLFAQARQERECPADSLLQEILGQVPPARHAIKEAQHRFSISLKEPVKRGMITLLCPPHYFRLGFGHRSSSRACAASCAIVIR